MEYKLAPVAIFAYNRVDTLKQVIDSLVKCELAADTDVFIFSDGPKRESDTVAVGNVRDYLQTIKEFKNISLFLSSENKGLGNSIITGVTQIINQHGKIIVLEDDLLLSSNFLQFMNDALNYYENNPKVFSVSGFMFDIRQIPGYEFDVFLPGGIVHGDGLCGRQVE